MFDHFSLNSTQSGAILHDMQRRFSIQIPEGKIGPMDCRIDRYNMRIRTLPSLTDPDHHTTLNFEDRHDTCFAGDVYPARLRVPASLADFSPAWA